MIPGTVALDFWMSTETNQFSGLIESILQIVKTKYFYVLKFQLIMLDAGGRPSVSKFQFFMHYWF